MNEFIKVSTVNVNGIRSATTKGLNTWIASTQPKVICLQEIKANSSQIPEEIEALDYYKYWHPAEKKGYSGVAILSKDKPFRVTEGIGVDWVDAEGRVLTAEFDAYRVVSVYAPSGTTGEVRQQVKYEFLDVYQDFVLNLIKDGKPTVFGGDFNIAHKEVDIHNPVSNKNSSGFLPEERAWFSQHLDKGLVDVYRHYAPSERDVYSWWSFRAGARARNKGWRIDYQLLGAGEAAMVKKAWIETDLIVSDHAPVTAEYSF